MSVCPKLHSKRSWKYKKKEGHWDLSEEIIQSHSCYSMVVALPKFSVFWYPDTFGLN